MSDVDNSLITMTMERLNAKFDEVIDTIGEMKVTISNANSNNERFLDSIKHIHERIDHASKDIEILKSHHADIGCLPLKSATRLRDEQMKNMFSGLEHMTNTLNDIKKDVDGLKIKIALWSGGISVGVSMISVFLKGLGK